MRAARLLAFAFLAAVVGLAIVCAGRITPPDEATPAPPADHTGPPLTDADYRSFGVELEKAVKAGDVAAADRLCRVAEFAERWVADLDLPAAVRRQLVTGLIQAGPGRRMVGQVKGGGSYMSLGVRAVDGQPRLVMRAMGADRGLNCHRFTLARYPDGAVGVDDIDILATGEPFSRTARRLILMAAGPRVSRVTEVDRAYADNRAALQKMAEDDRAGRHAAFLAGFRRLPAELQREKWLRIKAIFATHRAGDREAYLAEVDRFGRDHPDDPAAELMSLDYFGLDRRLVAFDRVAAWVGGDPHLTCLRATALVKAGRFSEAKATAEKAVGEDPAWEAAYRIRIEVALKEKDHPAARDTELR